MLRLGIMQKYRGFPDPLSAEELSHLTAQAQSVEYTVFTPEQ
jgi:hypothetical protein